MLSKQKVLAVIAVIVFSIGALTSCAQAEDNDTTAGAAEIRAEAEELGHEATSTTDDESSTATTTTRQTTATRQTTTTTTRQTTTTEAPAPVYPPETTERETWTYAPEPEPEPVTQETYVPPVTERPAETTEQTTQETTPPPPPQPAYDEQTAAALRQAGEEEFYAIVEYAEAYHVRVENISIIRETDTQFGICGQICDEDNWCKDYWIICKCEFENGSIRLNFYEITMGKSPNEYDNYGTYVTKDDLLYAIATVGYLDE